MYFTSLQKPGMRLDVPISICTCRALQEANHAHTMGKLMQFLFGLNECCEHTVDQILLLDPIALVSRAYFKILKV